MDKDKDSQPGQAKSRGNKLQRKRLTQKRDYLRMVKKITKNSADKGLTNRKQTIDFVKLMLRIEDSPSKFKMLKILANTNHVEYLKLFLNNHGLKILYLWMIRCKETEFYLKIAILKILAALPISSKTALKTAKVWDLVKKWSNSMKENEQDDIQVVYVNNSDENNDKDFHSSNSECIADGYSGGIADSPEIVELEENCDRRKTGRTKDTNRNEISNNCEKDIKSITLDSDCDEITEIGSQVQTKCYDESGLISEDFVQDIIMKMAIILKERKLSPSSTQSEINLESSSQNNTIQRDKKSIEPSRVSISSADGLSDQHEPFNSLDTKIADNLSKSKDCVNIESSSKQKNWTAADVRILALKLLEQWKDLKEVFKIPKIKPVESEKTNGKTEEIKDSPKTSNNVDKNKDKRDNNQGNNEVNKRKSTDSSSQAVSKKSTTHHKRHRIRHRNRKFEKFGNSLPRPDLNRYQFRPQDYLGLYQQRNVNYEYYPSYLYLNQLPWQMTPMNYYH